MPAINIKDKIKKECERYRGIKELVEAVISDYEKKSLKLDYQIQMELSKMVQAGQEWESLAIAAENLSEKELEIRFMDVELRNGDRLGSDEKEKMKEFFEKTEDSFSRTEGWKNLYHVYLKNTTLAKNNDVYDWKKEKATLEKDFLEVKAGVSDEELRFIDDRLSRAEQGMKKYKEELDACSAVKEYEKFNKEYTNKYGKKTKTLARKADFERERAQLLDRLDKAEELMDNVSAISSTWNGLTDDIKYYKEKADEYKKIVSNRKDNLKQIKKLQKSAAEKANNISELRSYGKAVKEYLEIDEFYNMFEREIVKIDPNWRENEVAIGQLDEKNGKNFMETFQSGVARYLNVYKEELERLTIEDVWKQILKKRDQVLDDMSDEERFVKNDENYRKLFQSTEMLERENKEETYSSWLYEHDDGRQAMVFKSEAEEARNEYMNRFKEQLAIIYKSTGKNYHAITSTTDVKNAEEIIGLLEQTRDTLYADLKKIEEQYEMFEQKEEVRQAMEKNPEVVEHKKQYEEAKKEVSSLKRTKDTIDQIKSRMETLKGKIKPDVIESDIQEKASNFYDQKTMRQGSHSDSKEYKRMMLALQVVKEWNSADMQNRLKEQKNAPTSLTDALKCLKTESERYLTAKNAQFRPNPSALRQARLGLANAIKEFAEDSLKDMKLTAAKIESPQAQASMQERTSVAEANVQKEMEAIGISFK